MFWNNMVTQQVSAMKLAGKSEYVKLNRQFL